MKNCLITLSLIFSFIAAFGQAQPTLVLYEFNTTQEPVYNNTVVNATTLNVYNYNLTSSFNPNYKFYNVQTTRKTDFYLHLQVGPRSGRLLNLSSFNFDLGKDVANNGPTDVRYQVRTSLDNYASVLASGAGGAAQQITIPLGDGFKFLTSLIEFRIYIFNPNTVASEVYNVDNIDIKGVSEVIPTTLPVTMLFFEGKYENKEINLHWGTASEKSNDRFEIERSLDGTNFKKIGEVKGSGTTGNRNDYSFTDQDFATVNYYRIKQVDFDGKNEYFKMISVKAVRQTEMFMVYTANEKSVMQVNEDNMAFKLIDLNGRTIASSTLGKGNHDLKVTTAGIYFVILSKGNSIQQKRVFLQ